MKRVLLCIAFGCMAALSHAQYFTGTTVKDYTLNNIINYPVKTKKISGFKGKVLILDFWSSNCPSCIASFPKMDRLAKKYKKDIEFMLVAVAFTAKSRAACQEIFSRHQKKYALTLSTAFDTTMFKDFDISGVPHAIVIGKDGTILASSSTFLLTDSVMERLAAGRGIKLTETLPANVLEAKQDSIQHSRYDLAGDLSLIKYWSMLAAGKPGLPMANASFSVRTGNSGIRALNFPGIYIYKRFCLIDRNREFPLNRIVYEMKNPSRLIDSNYSFELIVPDELMADRMKIARQEFNKGLGITSCTEKRMLPCLVLVADDTLRLSTKGGVERRTEKDRGSSGFTYRNVSMDYLLFGMNEALSKVLPVVDETGIRGNIDIDIEFDLLKPPLERYQQSIAPYGLRLIEANREIEVLVIKDEIMKY